MDTIKKNTLLFRDGVSRQQNNAERLGTSYIQVEDRGVEELIAEAQKISKELLFFNEKNEANNTTWESFLIEDSDAYFKASESDKAFLQSEWANQLASYVENPDRFLEDTVRLSKLSQPHTVLFLTFLKLINHIKSKINGLTQKHLDFYFKERLQLTPKDAIPDEVNILIELTENIDALEVKKGTVFLAGEDGEGNELQYTSTEDTVINQAQISELKSVFVDQQVFTIQTAHIHAIEKSDNGLNEMFKIAFGSPNPGDQLPKFPTGITSLEELNIAVDENKEAEKYVNDQLFLKTEDFKFIVESIKAITQITLDLQKSYTLLENAYESKIKETRKSELKEFNDEKGFVALIKQIFGTPNAGDDVPEFEGEPTSFDAIDKKLTDSDPGISQKAKDYVEEELKLNETDFKFLVKTSKATNASETDLEKFYQLLEQSERRYRGIVITPPSKEKMLHIYAEEDLENLAFSQYGKSEESKHFKTFGSEVAGSKEPLKTAELGFALSSPLLLLKEGTRKITLLLELSTLRQVWVEMESKMKALFKVYLSGEEDWFQPVKQPLFITQYYVTSEANKAILGDFRESENVDNLMYFFEPGSTMVDPIEENIGKIIINYQRQIFKITEFKKDNLGYYGTYADYIGQLNHKPEEYAFMISEADLGVLLQLDIALAAEEPAITSNNTSNELVPVKTPTIAFVVDQETVTNQNNESDVNIFNALMAVVFTKVTLNVAVQDIKNTVVQNDDSSLNIKKPFEPFGFEPEIGSSFYFANEEISQKPIKDLKITTEWINKPEDFGDYYHNYVENFGTNEEKNIISGDTDFKGNLFLFDQFGEISLKKAVPLFTKENAISIQDIPALIDDNKKGYSYKQIPVIDTSETEVTEWQRYFRLELDPLDFQHKTYNELLTKQALSGNHKEMNAPYQPKLKNFRIGYTASAEILLEDNGITANNSLFNIHPFGYTKIATNEQVKLLPTYDDNGSLYVGISKLIPSQTFTILFQMAEGSANPDVKKPVVQWSYLRDNKWIILEKDHIISDTTNGLLNTGIVSVQLPEDATLGGTLLSNELHWLQISAAQNIDAISDIIAMKSQVINATLSSETVADEHYQTPLQEESITETLQFIPEIESISQPFTSSKGRPAEQGIHFNKRISERLRHKNRAVTMWDYEHLILDKFPEVFKVKCLPPMDEIGKVNVTLVPDMRNSLPFNPFSPKVSAATLARVTQFLNNCAPAYATICVKNPTYLKVSTRCSVKFYEGYDQIFYTSKLNEEIKQFLSPWAYGKPESIRIGGTLDAGMLINFIAERPYIDFVSNLKLFQRIDEEELIDVRTINNGENIIIPDQPDMIMVSDENHIIDVVDENNYDEDSETGINYMIVERDFIVT